MSRKYIVLLASLLFFTSYCFGQSQSWQILTAARPLTSITFVSPTKGWVFGGDIAFKTSDGGLSWSVPIRLNVSIGGVPVYGIRSQKMVYFIDSLKGWACQYSNLLLKTTNGGNSWINVNAGSNYITLLAVFFTNYNTGWAAGWDDLNSIRGVIVKTTNGGNNWNVCSRPFNNEISSIWMLDESRGFCSTRNEDNLATTTDGGINWNLNEIGNGQPINRIFFPDTIHGWVLGNDNYVSKTTNRGLSWILYSNQIGNTSNFFFSDTLYGWICESTDNRGIWKTSNGGTNWISTLNLHLNNDQGLDVYFRDHNTGWVSTDDGILLETTNSGSNWFAQINHPSGNIYSLKFADLNTGWLLSGGYIWKSTNRGFLWTNLGAVNNASLNRLDFVNNQTGFICGNYGNIAKTQDGGNSWNQINKDSNNYNSMKFLDENTGWCCGSYGHIIKTTNGGDNWVRQSSSVTKYLNSICFVNAETGFIAADSGCVLKSTNGGENWYSIYSGGDITYNAIQFVNSMTGFVIGNRVYYSGYIPYSIRELIKTTDGGSNWASLINQTLSGYHFLNNVFFLNDQTGWVLTNDNIIKYTTNGGNSFYDQNPINCSFNCIYFVDMDNGWIGGDNGTILSTVSPIGIHSISFNIPNRFSLSQNYPNPFNPQTKIKFDISKQSFAKLIIYDILGREVATLVNEELKPGTYSYDWDGSNYASGIYFYQLVASDYVKTMRMVLLK